MSSRKEKADSITDSITEKKPAKRGDTSRQHGTKQKTPSRSTSHSTRAKRARSETWYNTILLTVHSIVRKLLKGLSQRFSISVCWKSGRSGTSSENTRSLIRGSQTAAR